MFTVGFEITALILHWLIVFTLSTRVIMQRRAVGVSLSWLTVILLIPFFGAIIYILVGENRLGTKRAERAVQLQKPYHEWLKSLGVQQSLNFPLLNPACEALHRQAIATIGMPALAGNQLRLLDKTEETLQQMLNDINQAKETCHLVFYICQTGGLVDNILNALIKAVQRGVECRLLVDAVGSHEFINSAWLLQLRQAGVAVEIALPVNVVRSLFVRLDLRNHRKIIVIDNEIAYTGSMNLTDPRYFKQHDAIGLWVDAMVRVTGAAAKALNAIFAGDWEMETDISLKTTLATETEANYQQGSIVQVIPSGPGLAPTIIHGMLLTTIYTARKELIITTPYFVPDEAMQTALCTAAHRGVAVTILVPSQGDSLLVRFASRAHFDELMEAGVKIAGYYGGLLHSKTISVDGEFSLIGSVNMDMRSFWLNFEITLFVYDEEFTQQVKTMQLDYLKQAYFFDPVTWKKRPALRRFMENATQLLSPLL
ncbi:phosphatidylserine/phosphatidylglycerophosphate/cardiolipin synthase [Beggiatoa alba B18LD]|uniref:Cardiolipin synthase A n=1 Tax=Beggiatoa alba B18LD TaxID=395493 RepID=I3CF24_9GAMM|nr:cardiolipin synthase [Beggiatoa alba]EIJ42217.1 phosphatidylserine/phosphatidylglycerophosphate/cardiolipin synthase [Beggiatoa alba B18LD]